MIAITVAPVAIAQPTVEDTKNWLLSLGLAPLPVAPAQDPHAYPLRDKQGVIQYEKDGVTPKPRFTGKNPSYLDAKNVPHLVTHSKFQNRQPSKRQLQTWFTNPQNGIGALGSDHEIWLDFDVKNFTDAVECRAKALAVAETILNVSGHPPTLEETHSGGWRVLAIVPEKPTFTNFALEPGGKHVGEALGTGRFTVLAPTVGVSGKPYTAYHRHTPDNKPVVPSLEAIGVYPTGKSKSSTSASAPIANKPVPTKIPTVPATPTEAPNPETLPSTPMIHEYPHLNGIVFDLADLGTPLSKEVLHGSDEKGDRSASLTLAIKEWYGWENWCRVNGITYRGDTRTLALAAGEKLGVDADRVQRILDGIDANACTTASEFKNGEDSGCWKKVLRLAGVKAGRKHSSNASAKILPLPTALPKAVGSNDNSPPLPPNYGGGRGGFNPNNDDVDWRPPEAYKGQLGVWVYPKNDEPFFDAKCNFDFVVVKEFERYVADDGEPTDPDGGGLQLNVTRAADGKTKTILITSQDYASAKTFTAALKKRLGLGIKCRISDYDLQALLHTKLVAYHRNGGKVYTLASMIGQQPDGTRVFPSLQISANGTPVNETPTWVFNPHISEVDFIPSPNIPIKEAPHALRELLEAQRDFAQGNFLRFLLANGWVAACLHEQEIMRQEKFMPVFNAYGDAGSGKTIAMESALSLVWGDSGNGMIASTSVSMAYERLAKTGSIPCCWDDPPSKSKPEREALDEFVKRQYNKFPRLVRGNVQKPNSSMAITSNHCIGETLPATATRIVGAFFPTVPVNKEGYPRLRKAMAQAPGAFRSLLEIGYNSIAVHETRRRLIPHLRNAHDRAADNWALVVWYAQRVVGLAGLDIDVEAWVIENICPTLNEDQKGLNSATDFITRLMALHTENKAGTWNAKIVTNRNHGECLALELKTLWAAVERSGDPPPYNQKLLENVLVSKGCVRGVSTKFNATREGVLNFLRELGKGANKGEDWVPPTPPPQVSKRALLIPKRLWEEFGFDPDALAPMPTPPPTPPSENMDECDEWDAQDSSYTPVTPSYSQLQQSVTSETVDVASVSGSSSTSSYKVTKKIEERESEQTPVEKTLTPKKKTDDAIVAPAEKLSAGASGKIVTSVTSSKTSPETPNSQGLDVVTQKRNLGVTRAAKSVTLTETGDNETEFPPTLDVAHRMVCCATPADVEALYAEFSTELVDAAKDLLGPDERERFAAIATLAEINLDVEVQNDDVDAFNDAFYAIRCQETIGEGWEAFMAWELAQLEKTFTLSADVEALLVGENGENEPSIPPTSETEAPYPNLVGKRLKCVRQGTMYGKVFTIKSQADDVYYWGRHGDHFECADLEEIQGGTWKILD